MKKVIAVTVFADDLEGAERIAHFARLFGGYEDYEIRTVKKEEGELTPWKPKKKGEQRQ